MRIWLAIFLLLFSILLNGCSSDTTAAPLTGHASAVITIKWPDRARFVPLAANSILIGVSGPHNFSDSQTINYPANTATFNSLPLGSLTFTATAYPQANAAGNALAIGSVTMTSQADQQLQVPITMATTITQLTFTPANPYVVVNNTLQMAVTASDAGGNIVLLTPNEPIVWASDNTSVATVGQSTGLVAGVNPGTANISATVQGVLNSVQVTVGTNAVGAPTAAFTVTPATGYPSTAFQFDASPCSDPVDPASALQVQWDWTNSGTFTTYTTTKTATHQFATPGSYIVTLQVINTHGVASTCTHTVTVKTPNVTINPLTQTISVGDTLNITAVVDNDTTIVPLWSVLDANGGTITPTGGTGATYTAPAAAGTYHVIATDPNDPTNKATATITVQSGGANINVN